MDQVSVCECVHCGFVLVVNCKYAVCCGEDVEVLNQLARMKQWLQSERRRVEVESSREQVHILAHSIV